MSDVLAGQERSYLSQKALEQSISGHEEQSPHLIANGRWTVGSPEYLNAGREVLETILEQKADDIRDLVASQNSWQRLISKQHGMREMKRFSQCVSWDKQCWAIAGKAPSSAEEDPGCHRQI